MKIALLLSMVCAACFFGGCSTEQGGPADTTEHASGYSYETHPAITDPSLPQNPNTGPQIPPP
jgi:ABC-type oligopeptide transport system substrate-binding subunit